jgi:hypothetical protein
MSIATVKLPQPIRFKLICDEVRNAFWNIKQQIVLMREISPLKPNPFVKKDRGTLTKGVYAHKP